MKRKLTNSFYWFGLGAGILLAGAPLHASDNDDRIVASAKKSYVFKTYLAHDSIKTVAEDGVVTLTGTVADASHKSLAEDTVEGLPGVTRVDNRLTVKGETPSEHSNGWLMLKVKTALLFHRNVSASGTEVIVNDGVVTLRGEADSMAQKELTTEYAKDVEGVSAVKNEMTIGTKAAKSAETAGEMIDDASITAQVKASLVAHRSTSALKTRITTRNGVVTATGPARNAAEKSLVTKLINDIYGVKSVDNEMTVAVPTDSNN